MRIYYHIGFRTKNLELETFLKDKVSKMSTMKIFDDYLFSFDLYKDSPFYNEVLDQISGYNPLSIEILSYTKKEISTSKWLSVTNVWGNVDPVDDSYDMIYEKVCVDFLRGCSLTKQKSSYRARCTPKWKNNRNFCCDTVGGWDNFFCSDYAKTVIQSHDIKGVEFLPVLHYKSQKPLEDINQILITETLAHSSFEFEPPAEIRVCEKCGSKSYHFKNLNSFQLFLNENDLGLDAYKTPKCIGPGAGFGINIISQKFYHVLNDVLKEKSLRYKCVKEVDDQTRGSAIES